MTNHRQLIGLFPFPYRPSVVWLKDGQRYLGNGRVYVPAESSDVIQLHIGAVQREDQGMYQCFASNDEGDTAQASVQLAIGGKQQQDMPRIIIHHNAALHV